MQTLTLMTRRAKTPLWFYGGLSPRAYFSDKTTKATMRAPMTEADQMAAIFAQDSTLALIKKLCIYRMMSSNAFINHALRGMQLSYRLMGRSLTNFLINKTAGSIFTSGETLQTLAQDIAALKARKINGVANYVVEGLHEMDEAVIQKVYEDLIESIKVLTQDG
jgi:hypothetical protein